MSTNRAQIESTYDRFSAAWKTNDGAATAGFFVEDGSLINPFGERADGRAAIAAMYTTNFGAGMLRGTTTSVKLSSVRDLGPDLAFVDGDQTIHGADGKAMLVVHISALLRRDGDTWRFVDARPYVNAARPG